MPPWEHAGTAPGKPAVLPRAAQSHVAPARPRSVPERPDRTYLYLAPIFGPNNQ